jgi:hypothetical protein
MVSVYGSVSKLFTVLRIRIRDPVLFYPWIRDPGWVNNQFPDPGLDPWIQDHISESLETIFWVNLKVLSSEMDPVEIRLIR